MKFIAFACIFLFHQAGWAQKSCTNLKKNIKLDEIWGGAKVQFSAIEAKRHIFVGYYDSERYLSLIRINKCTGHKEKIRTPSKFDGWDSHKNIVLYEASDGSIHFLGNMHASLLTYAYARNEDDISSLGLLRKMTGRDESQVTYPVFLELPNRRLGFFYRNGGSGSGEYILKEFNGEKWSLISNAPIFSRKNGSSTVSAYPTKFLKDGDGYFHIAWVWRKNRNVESNFSVNYAKTKDFIKWTNAKGDEISTPIAPSPETLAANIGEQRGLINNIALTLDRRKNPIISYLEFDEDGATQLFHAYFKDASWQTLQATSWSYRWAPKGEGSIPMEIGFSGIIFDDPPRERIVHPEFGSAIATYDPVTLKVSSYEGAISKESTLNSEDLELNPGRISPWQKKAIEIQKRADISSTTYSIEWGVSATSNRDKPHSCGVLSEKCRITFGMFLRLRQ